MNNKNFQRSRTTATVALDYEGMLAEELLVVNIYFYKSFKLTIT